MAAGAMRTVKSAVSRRRQAEDLPQSRREWRHRRQRLYKLRGHRRRQRGFS